MNATSTRRTAAALMVGASGLAVAGFTALGSVFDYPDVLQAPTADILAAYRAHSTAISGWFVALAVGAALLAPVGVLLGRLDGGRRGRWIAGLGIAAATVQVVGLSRWFLLVPGVSADALVPARTAAAHRTFETLHLWLGTVVGETVGYALTAAFTVLLARAAGERFGLPRWLVAGGHVSAALIATGVVIPLGVGPADLANFAGYVLWCLWLIAVGVALAAGARPPARRTSAAEA